MIATLFGLEIALVGLTGGVIGAVVGTLLAHYVGASVFHESVQISWVLPFLIVPGGDGDCACWARLSLCAGHCGLEPAVILREGV